MALAVAGLLLGAVPMWAGDALREVFLWGTAATLKTTLHELGHVVYALAARAGVLPPLPGDDVANVISQLVELALGEAVVPGERRLEDLFYLGALGVTAFDALCSLPGLAGADSLLLPPGVWCWEIRF